MARGARAGDEQGRSLSPLATPRLGGNWLRAVEDCPKDVNGEAEPCASVARGDILTPRRTRLHGLTARTGNRSAEMR